MEMIVEQLDFMLQGKVCSKCGEFKGYSEYGKRTKGSVDGYNGICKKCNRESSKLRYENNKEKIRETNSVYYKENSRKIKEYKKEFYKENKDIISECRKKFYKENKDRIKGQKRIYYENNKEKIRERDYSYRTRNVEKIKERNKIYYKENKESIKKYQKKYNNLNKEYIKSRSKSYVEINKIRIYEIGKLYREKNKGIIKERKEVYRKENKDKIRESQRKYWQSERGKVKMNIKVSKRRALIKGNGGSYTVEQWKECLNYFNNECAYTGQVLDNEILHVEHVQAISKGGTSYIWNLCPSIASANLSKNNSELEEWYKQQEYYSEERLNKIYEWQEYSYNKYIK